VPTGGELVARYIEPLAEALAPFLQFGARVTAVTRLNADKMRTAGREALPFVLRIAAQDGALRQVRARAIIDASAGIPDLLGADRATYAGRTTAVMGSGHSALNALIELAAVQTAAPGTRILWMLRKENIDAAFGGEAADALPERGALGTQGRALVDSGAVQVVAPFRTAAIAAGDMTAARRVELALPETGVCSAPPAAAASAASPCCGGPAPDAVAPCCGAQQEVVA
jgi:hypothetical protein